MGAAREKDQADFDLERFIDMFDEALTSNDERVVNALRSLMMMVILTTPEGRKGATIGPLRRVLDDQNNILRRLESIEREMTSIVAMNRRYGTTAVDAKDHWGLSKWELEDQKMKDLERAIKHINSPFLKKHTDE
jgi:hypothetical protein